MKASELVAYQRTQVSFTSHSILFAGDKLVLLADVDKQGATDLVKLLNRQANSHTCLSLHPAYNVIQSSSPLWFAACTVQTETMQVTRNTATCRYKLRAKVDIADVTSEYTTWARFGPGLMPEGKSLYGWQSLPFGSVSELCYDALGVQTSLHQPVPQRRGLQ